MSNAQRRHPVTLGSRVTHMSGAEGIVSAVTERDGLPVAEVIWNQGGTSIEPLGYLSASNEAGRP
jgi:hypothetical protein